MESRHEFKLADFGISQYDAGSIQKIEGTPEYMRLYTESHKFNPNIILNAFAKLYFLHIFTFSIQHPKVLLRQHAVDSATDLWSFAITLLHCCNGKLPFQVKGGRKSMAFFDYLHFSFWITFLLTHHEDFYQKTSNRRSWLDAGINEACYGISVIPVQRDCFSVPCAFSLGLLNARSAKTQDANVDKPVEIHNLNVDRKLQALVITETWLREGNLHSVALVIDSHGLKQHVETPTHQNGHLLDLVISRVSGVKGMGN
ncbi:hypothetical protein CAPTEDRAFT_196430 [Capitella teleta]|uniref:Protein kinase domain-containing protein n=1 Tax=Capitella teleta TaxID=283909 RepID=R7TG13_CAPTE|nr:hypothetical protein CAPTEDRAFT_196430 [Capitella teleta]|eukprot:ELT90486.1 hypothetical protein CAPTEDRAFT_196430 [Capitella teleta]